jgi:molybdate/tungstate transport system substrate-binding protein
VLAGAAGGAAVLGGIGVTARSLQGSGNDRVTALVAGSLYGLARAVPGASVEAHGSAAVRQLIRDGARDPDAVAVADPRLMAGIADSARLFATNALVLAYNPDADAASRIQSDWKGALTASDVRIGRTDPAVDPLGYRTVMALRLAEGVDAEAVLDRSFVRPETEVTNLVERGDLDCAFVYANMATELDLPAVDLPARIDFSDPAHADDYASVSVEVAGETYAGAPIRYAGTALTDRGETWIESLMTDRDRLEEYGFVVPESYPEPYRVDG